MAPTAAARRQSLKSDGGSVADTAHQQCMHEVVCPEAHALFSCNVLQLFVQLVIFASRGIGQTCERSRAWTPHIHLLEGELSRWRTAALP